MNQQILSHLISNDSTLNSVNVSQDADQCVTAINELLRPNNSLKCIDLSVKYITDQGAKSLSDALQQNTTLKSLFLNINYIYIQDAEKLVHAVMNKTNLTSIVLSFDYIFDHHGITTIDDAMVGVKFDELQYVIPMEAPQDDLNKIKCITILMRNDTDTNVKQKLSDLNKVAEKNEETMKLGHHTLLDLLNDDNSLISTLPCDMCIINDIIRHADDCILDHQIIWEL
jgi:hypothetical protein